MAKYILNCAFHILNQSLPCDCFVIPVLVFYWSTGVNSTHHEGSYWLGNILCTFMTAAGESAVFYPHDGGG